MKFDITWTITAIIAVSSFLSPIFVAIINNRHHYKIRLLEINHDEELRKIDLQQQNTTHQFDIYYADKKKAFLDFLQAAGTYSADPSYASTYAEFQSAAQSVLLFCNDNTKTKLISFLEIAETINEEEFDFDDLKIYNQTLSECTTAMSLELESSKPCIDSEQSKSNHHKHRPHRVKFVLRT